MDLVNGKRVVVTGAASDIGAAIANCLTQEGAHVIGIDIRETNECHEFFEADLGKQASIDALLGALPEGIDGLANVAGLPPTMSAPAVLKVNLVGLKYLTKQLAGRMNDGGSIVNLASLAGANWAASLDQVHAANNLDFESVEDFVEKEQIEAQPGRSYFLGKEALIVWTMQNRWTWRNRGIRMNAVSPGAVDTPILADFLKTLGKKADENRKVMDRPATPEDIAPMVAFLLSDQAGWFRGANIALDGGQFAHMTASRFGF